MRRLEIELTRLLSISIFSITVACGCGSSMGEKEQPSELLRHLHMNGAQLDLRGTGLTDDQLAYLKSPAFQRVTKLYLSSTRITDGGIKHIRPLPLEELDLHRTEITDAGLAALAGLKLKRLNLSSTRIGNEGLAYLNGMPLEMLDLGNTQITDDGVLSLNIPTLKYLDISNTEITGKTFEVLQQLTGLKDLDVTGTKLTDPGLRRLTSLPRNTRVYLFDTNTTQDEINLLGLSRPDLILIVDAPTR